MSQNIALDLHGIHRNYGQVVAVNNVSIAVEKGEFVTLLGPSGSGKTTTLRLIGGFEKLDRGSIRLNGERIDHLPPYSRDTATIFQSGALFPHKTVAENIAYGLRMRKLPKAEIAARIKQSLDIVKLNGFDDRLPSQLSGGQKQRVALARSIAVRPAILLFDEPLSALDLSLRLQLRAEIKRLHDELQFSAIYVTHDQGEAMAMSSRVAVMNRGCIEQIDRPKQIYDSPANEFVYRFIGESCCLQIQVVGGDIVGAADNKLDMQLSDVLPEGMWRIYVRPSRVRLGDNLRPGDNRLKARLHVVEFLGDFHRYHLRAGEVQIFCDHQGDIGKRVGDIVDVGWQSDDMSVFR